MWGPKGVDWVGTGPVDLIGADGADGAPGADGADGAPGTPGSQIYMGTVPGDPPAAGLGITGDYFIDPGDEVLPLTLWGPKLNDNDWSGVTAQGLTGPQGDPGADGKTIWSDTANPTTQGVNGDFFIRTDTQQIWGPKANSSWIGTGPTNLKGTDGADGADGAPGADGADGAPGADGADGADGKTILSGTVDPDDVTDGVDGDFYIRTDTNQIWGPKGTPTPDSWTGTGPRSIKGDTGPAAISAVQIVDPDWVPADGLPAGSGAGTLILRRRSSI